jgi:single-strand DNA-binding protein
MAGSVNKVIIVGNVGRDPEIRVGHDGSKMASFSVATSERWKDKETSEMRSQTEWHRVVVFNPRLAEVVEKFVRKGQTVFVEGELKTRTWMNKEDVEQKTTEVVISRFRGEVTMLGNRSEAGQAPALSEFSPGADLMDQDDEIPF